TSNLAASFKALNVRFYYDAESTHMEGERSRGKEAGSPRDQIWRSLAPPGEVARRSAMDLLRRSFARRFIDAEGRNFSKISASARLGGGPRVGGEANQRARAQ